MASVHESFAIHHAYALATLRILAFEILSTLKPATEPSLRFFSISVPPTFVSPRSRKKSHRQNWRVILAEWEVRQSCCPAKV